MNRYGAARLLALGLVLTRLLGGCDERPDSSPAATTAKAPTPAAPAPANLVAELYIAEPQSSWLAMRDAVRGPTLMLPRSIGGLAVNILGLPLRAVSEFREDKPIVGAAVTVAAQGGDGGTAERRDSSLALVWALPIRDGRRFIAQASMGSEATYQAAAPQPNGLTVLAPRDPDSSNRWGLGLSLAVLDGHAVVATHAEAATTAGAYLTRTLARRKPTDWTQRTPPRPNQPSASPRGRAPDGVLRIPTAQALGALLPVAERAIDSLARRLPAFVEPLVDTRQLRELLRRANQDLSGADLSVHVGANAVTLAGRLHAADAEAAARLKELGTLPVDHLLDLPDDTLLALAWHEQPASRRGDALDSAKRIGAWLSGDLNDDELGMIEAGVDNLAAGRGEDTIAGVRCTGAGITGFAHGTVADAKRLRRGVEGLAAFHRHGAVAARLKKASLRLSSAKIRLPDVAADVLRWRLASAAAVPATERETNGSAATNAGSRAADELDAPAYRDPVDLLVAIGPSRFWAAGGLQARDTMLFLVKPDPERVLRTRQATTRVLERLDDPVWFAALADPLAMAVCHAGRPGSAAAAPLLIALGPTGEVPHQAHRTNGDAWLVVEAATVLLQAAASLTE